MGTRWMEQAACRSADPDMFFPTRGDGNTSAAAKRICGTCDVVDLCFKFALKNHYDMGVWGGTTAKERYLWRRNR